MRKSLFPGFFEPTEDEFRQLWNDALIVPDTSALMILFRLDHATRDEMMSVLREQHERLWIPHQVALEFTAGWKTAVEDSREAYRDARTAIQKLQNPILEEIKKIERFKGIDPRAERARTEQFIGGLRKTIKDAEQRLLTDEEAEHLFSEIAILADDIIGTRPNLPERARWRAEASIRAASGIPPGNRDKNKPTNAEGDYFIWRQMIARAGAERRAVIFVTDDKKDDWFKKKGDKVIAPRSELIDEFFELSGQRFHGYTLVQFLKWAKHHLGIRISEDAEKDVAASETPPPEPSGPTPALTMAELLVRRPNLANDLHALQAMKAALQAEFDACQTANEKWEAIGKFENYLSRWRGVLLSINEPPVNWPLDHSTQDFIYGFAAHSVSRNENPDDIIARLPEFETELHRIARYYGNDISDDGKDVIPHRVVNDISELS